MTYPNLQALQEALNKHKLIASEMSVINDKMEAGDKSPGLAERFGNLTIAAAKLDDRISELRTEPFDAATEEPGFGYGGARTPAAQAAQLGAFQGHPLAVPHDAFGPLDSALREGRGQIYNAVLTTTTSGQPGGWGVNTAPSPRLLHMVAKVPMQNIGAVAAEHPKFTLPTAAAGVGEGVTLGEYDSSTAGTVTLKRFGRFTDVSTESLVGTTTSGLTGMHSLGIAKDLDKVLIDAVESDAGSAVAFAADVPAAIRKRIHAVADATAAAATELVILAHPDDAHLLEDVTPASASDVAEGFTRFSGALVYVSSAVNTGFMTVANLAFGVRYFQAAGLRLETDYAPKTGVRTYASAVIGGYGTGLVSGYASMQDVVTP